MDIPLRTPGTAELRVQMEHWHPLLNSKIPTWGPALRDEPVLRGGKTGSSRRTTGSHQLVRWSDRRTDCDLDNPIERDLHRRRQMLPTTTGVERPSSQIHLHTKISGEDISNEACCNNGQSHSCVWIIGRFHHLVRFPVLPPYPPALTGDLTLGNLNQNTNNAN
ncbi:hypothetical protein VTO42DRAFT_336 [Malbranchea cinnamomea]